ncbi:MAG TPA: hypothetical protein VK464_08130 [Symbiobacteriaceae bacterium]|nr:hypothetical protein [Symbiobacteriaceae bacterium]
MFPATLECELFSLKEFHDPGLVERVLALIETHDPNLAPARYGPGMRAAYNADSRADVAARWLDDGPLTMEGPPPARARYFVDWDRRADRFNLLAFSVAPEYGATAEGARAMLGLATALADLVEPVFGRIHYLPPRHDNDADAVNLRVRLPYPSWVLFFGEPYLAQFGAERLLATPGVAADTLPSGLVRLRLGDSPLGVAPDLAEGVRQYLGENAFTARNRSVGEYSTGLAPVFDFGRKAGGSTFALGVRERSARVWLGVLPDAGFAPAGARVQSIATAGPAGSGVRRAAMEVNIHAGPRWFYALLGAEFQAGAGHDLAVEVAWSDAAGPNWPAEPPLRYLSPQVGLPEEYVQAVLDGAGSVSEVTALGPGRLVLRWAAHDEVGSSISIFRRLSAAVVRLLARDTWNEEELTALLGDL